MTKIFAAARFSGMRRLNRSLFWMVSFRLQMSVSLLNSRRTWQGNLDLCKRIYLLPLNVVLTHFLLGWHGNSWSGEIRHFQDYNQAD